MLIIWKPDLVAFLDQYFDCREGFWGAFSAGSPKHPFHPLPRVSTCSSFLNTLRKVFHLASISYNSIINDGNFAISDVLDRKLKQAILGASGFHLS